MSATDCLQKLAELLETLNDGNRIDEGQYLEAMNQMKVIFQAVPKAPEPYIAPAQAPIPFHVPIPPHPHVVAVQNSNNFYEDFTSTIRLRFPGVEARTRFYNFLNEFFIGDLAERLEPIDNRMGNIVLYEEWTLPASTPLRTMKNGITKRICGRQRNRGTPMSDDEIHLMGLIRQQYRAMRREQTGRRGSAEMYETLIFPPRVWEILTTSFNIRRYLALLHLKEVIAPTTHFYTQSDDERQLLHNSGFSTSAFGKYTHKLKLEVEVKHNNQKFEAILYTPYIKLGGHNVSRICYWLFNKIRKESGAINESLFRKAFQADYGRGRLVHNINDELAMKVSGITGKTRHKVRMYDNSSVSFSGDGIPSVYVKVSYAEKLNDGAGGNVISHV
jgi:hypothetical protein